MCPCVNHSGPCHICYPWRLVISRGHLHMYPKTRDISLVKIPFLPRKISSKQSPQASSKIFSHEKLNPRVNFAGTEFRDVPKNIPLTFPCDKSRQLSIDAVGLVYVIVHSHSIVPLVMITLLLSSKCDLSLHRCYLQPNLVLHKIGISYGCLL